MALSPERCYSAFIAPIADVELAAIFEIGQFMTAKQPISLTANLKQ